MVTIPQEVKNWLLRKHHAHTLKFKRKHSQMKLTSFYLFELSIASASVCDTTNTWLAQVVCDGVVLKNQGPDFLLRFFRLVMFRLFAFAFTFARISRRRESSSSISSRYRFFSIISRQPSGLSLLWGNWSSAPSVNKLKVGAFTTVFDFDLAFKKTAHKSLANHRAYLSLPHFLHNASYEFDG